MPQLIQTLENTVKHLFGNEYCLTDNKLINADTGAVVSLNNHHTGKLIREEFLKNLRLEEVKAELERLPPLAQTVTTMKVERITATQTEGTLATWAGVKAVLRNGEQFPEAYKLGDTLKVYVLSLSATLAGMRCEVSRTHPALVTYLLADYGVTVTKIVRVPGKMSHFVTPYTPKAGHLEKVSQLLAGEKLYPLSATEKAGELIRQAFYPAEVEIIELNYKKRIAKIRYSEKINLSQKKYLTGWHFVRES
jgi:transcription antitermination factor NusA-like protein